MVRALHWSLWVTTCLGPGVVHRKVFGNDCASYSCFLVSESRAENEFCNYLVKVDMRAQTSRDAWLLPGSRCIPLNGTLSIHCSFSKGQSPPGEHAQHALHGLHVSFVHEAARLGRWTVGQRACKSCSSCETSPGAFRETCLR